MTTEEIAAYLHSIREKIIVLSQTLAEMTLKRDRLADEFETVSTKMWNLEKDIQALTIDSHRFLRQELPEVPRPSQKAFDLEREFERKKKNERST